MSISWVRIRTVIRKELRDYRRNRLVVLTMTIMPLVFLAVPVAILLALPASSASAASGKRLGLSLIYLLLIPVLVPATVSGYSVVGEREQGTLEPLLTTPISREELLIGKAAAAMIPSVAIAYAVFGVFLAIVRAFADPAVSSAVFHQSSVLVAQVVFTPLLAAWAIWVGMAMSARSSDVRVAQQLGTLGSLPPLAVVALMAAGVIDPTFTLALALAVALLVVDLVAWRVVSWMFDRERLLTGGKPVSARSARLFAGSGPSPPSTSEPTAGETTRTTEAYITRMSNTMTLRLGLIFTLTGIIVLALRLLGRTGRLGTGAAIAVGIALLLVGLILLYVRLRSRCNGSRPPGADRSAKNR
jgi:hypothetical protein